MSIQQTVDLNTEEILIEQQIVILPGFFSVERVQVELFFFCYFCVFIHKLTLSCVFFMQLSPSQFGSHFFDF